MMNVLAGAMILWGGLCLCYLIVLWEHRCLERKHIWVAMHLSWIFLGIDLLT